MRTLNDRKIPIEEYPVSAVEIAEVIAAVEAEKVSVGKGREILARAVEESKPVAALLAEVGEQVSDDGALKEWIDAVIADNPNVIEQIEGGDQKPLGFLTGQVMKRSGGKANPKKVTGILMERFG